MHHSGVLGWAYRRLGRRYPATYLALELQTAFAVTAGTLALVTFYWDVDGDDFLLILGISIALTAVAIALNFLRTYPQLRPIQRWIAGQRSPERSEQAWRAAVALPANLIQRDMFLPIVIVVVPSCIAAVALLGLSWIAFLPLFAGSLVAVGYGAILHYLALELGMRPVLMDINREMAPRTRAGFRAIPLRVRLMAALPLINLITGLVVAALTSEGGGGANLGIDVLVAVAVATTISLELTVLLSKSILRPIADLQRATEALQRGERAPSVPVTTADELGELAASFNEMVKGLAERERIREAFGTYVDREIADYILSERYSEEGMELDVSILFCDVLEFTEFAAGLEAKEIVSTLNGLFEVVVPIVDRHGGHVDKFVGDGLLAVFGAPENHHDHADRAVRAACEMVAAVNEEGRAGEGIRIGIGINSGPVVAGAIGGAGRLNFSVIGDPVNVAARVEAATRELDSDSVLVTEETRERLGPGFELAERGRHRLRGIEHPVSLYAPRVASPATSALDGDGDGSQPVALRSLREALARAARAAGARRP